MKVGEGGSDYAWFVSFINTIWNKDGAKCLCSLKWGIWIKFKSSFIISLGDQLFKQDFKQTGAIPLMVF